MKPENQYPKLPQFARCWWVGLVFLCFLFHPNAQADMVTLKDGSILICTVVTVSKSPTSNAEYLQIRINNSLVWLSREFVAKVEKTPDRKPAGSEIQDILNRLIQEGKIVQDIPDSTKPPVSTPILESALLKAKSIRGWAYLYENSSARKEGKRILLKTGDPMQIGYILAISPNSRITLEIPGICEIGLLGNSQIRFDDIVANPTRRNYKIKAQLIRGKGWFRFGNDSVLSNVNFTLNAVRAVLQNITLFCESTETTNAVNITYVSGKEKPSFWRGSEGPYLVSEGQLLEISPAFSRIPISSAPAVNDTKQLIASWDSWQPEKLMMDLDLLLPPLNPLPNFPPIPALHAYSIPFDKSMSLPPETRSLGVILLLYREAIERYKQDVGHYPTNEHGLEALRKSFDIKSWKGPYVPLDLPRRDLWGSELVYELMVDKGKQLFDVRSWGPNRQDDKGLGDDIR